MHNLNGKKKGNSKESAKGVVSAPKIQKLGSTSLLIIWPNFIDNRRQTKQNQRF